MYFDSRILMSFVAYYMRFPSDNQPLHFLCFICFISLNIHLDTNCLPFFAFADHVREFNCGKLYYRTFQLDEERDSLYVGAMDRIFRLSLKNISSSTCDVSTYRDVDTLTLVAAPANIGLTVLVK
uniref:Uncharacterized protein n=1 Tax=Glossina brevipalpis TaxID=37001 RepID=A0A1A9WR74_9MUSC